MVVVTMVVITMVVITVLMEIVVVVVVVAISRALLPTLCCEARGLAWISHRKLPGYFLLDPLSRIMPCRQPTPCHH